MPRRSNRFVYLILTFTALTLCLGCTQPEDVISEVSSTRLTLVAERLPTLPDGMVYELWVTEWDGDYISLGKFSYDQVNREFLESDGTTPRVLGGEFTFEDDLLKERVWYDEADRQHIDPFFTNVFVSVENTPDDNGASPGPSMLSDIVTNPSDDLIELRFQSKDTTLGDATVRYNLESVSDGSRSVDGVGRGVWFTSYREVRDSLPDTLHYNVVLIPDTIDAEIDTTYDPVGDSNIYVITNWDEISAPGPIAISNEYVETTDVLFGPDTVYLSATPFQHIGYRVEFDSGVDLEEPYVRYIPRFSSWTINQNNVTLDIFSQDEFNLPDYSPWGWRYKGWVVTATGQTANTYRFLVDEIDARFTPPAWPYNSPTNKLIPGDTGALVTTGTFTVVDQPDDGNPFVLNTDLVPQYPGEDFLNTDSLDLYYGIDEPFDFLPASQFNEGAVFITIEPDNFTGNTNFPLIAFGKALPSSKYFTSVSGTDVQITMWNWTSTIDSDLRGFPKIRVDIERF